MKLAVRTENLMH